MDATFVLWVLLALLVVFAIRDVEDYVSDRRAMQQLLTRFGERFVQEFDRPLRSNPSDRAIDCELRLSPGRSRIEVLLAPRDGRRYPNLADHRKNVEYDISRVLELMKHPPFVQGPLYAQGRWVVVPFQLKVNRGQAGGK